MKLVFVIALALVVVCGGQSAARESSVKELIPKATVYSHQFIERFSNVVAEERYEQQITVPHRKRMLLSDFLLVKYPGDLAVADLPRRRRSGRQTRSRPAGPDDEAVPRAIVECAAPCV